MLLFILRQVECQQMKQFFFLTMKKTIYAIHLGVSVLYCFFFAGYVEHDVPIYVFSCLIALAFLFRHKFATKAFASHFLSIQTLTIWICYFFLDQRYQLITGRLNAIKGLLLGLFVLLEIVAILYLIKRYLSARREYRKFACESFSYAINPFPLIPELQKLFIVEFNIWRTLAVRLRLFSDKDGKNLEKVTKINPGYESNHIRLMIIILVVANCGALWLIEGWWLAIPFITTAYILLLTSSEILTFRAHGIYDTGTTLKIPNGVYGFVSIEKVNIDEVLSGTQFTKSDLSVSRFVTSNILIKLVNPISILGTPVKTISLCVGDKDYFQQKFCYEYTPTQ